MGPYLVTRDEIGNPYDLLMYTRQSGRTRDRAHSGAALLGIERVIAWYSSFASLYPGDVIHFATMEVDGLPRLAVPRFLNGPASSLGSSGPVEIPPRATDLVVSVELAVVVRALGEELVLGYLPLVSLCDRSFADAVVEPARAGERGIPAGPDMLTRTISAMITLFPGDVITLGSTAARLDLTRVECDAGVVVHGGIEGLGEATVTLLGSTLEGAR